MRNDGRLAPLHRRELLIGQHVDVLREVMHRAISEQKVASARMIAAEVRHQVQGARGW